MKVVAYTLFILLVICLVTYAMLDLSKNYENYFCDEKRKNEKPRLAHPYMDLRLKERKDK